MEQLYVLGTGNATAVESFHTCFVLKEEDQLFLTDSGGGVSLLKRLREMDLRLEDIHDIFISHAHMDHCLGVLWIIRVLVVPMELGEYSEPVRIYAYPEVLDILDQMCKMMLRPKFYRMIGKYIFFEPLQAEETRKIGPWDVHFFDIGSKKTPQLGYEIKLKNGRRLVFTGDEQLKQPAIDVGQGADWLLREVLCCYDEEAVFHAYKKKHATMKEACEQSVEMQVKHVVLWHLEDQTDRSIRKEKYLADAARWLAGIDEPPEVLVPDDGEIITL